MAENKSQMQDVQKRAQDVLNQLGIDTPIALKVLVLAVVSALLAAILDRILKLPADSLPVLLGGFIAVINGLTYAYLVKKENLTGAIMAAVAGFVALLVWWIATKIIGDQDTGFNFTYNPADAWNFGEVLLDGVLLGLLGFGWLALLKRLPDMPKRG